MHTPGPWTVDPKTFAVYAPDRHGHAAAVRVAQRGLAPLPAAEIAANAALMAAAPDLLAALQWALSQIDDSLDPDHQAALESARAVAARATGR